MDAEAVKTLVNALSKSAQELLSADDLAGRETVVAYPKGHGWEIARIPLVATRCHVFDELDSLISFLKRGQDGKLIDFLMDDERVTVHLEPVSVGGAVVSCKLVKHPEFEAWNAVFGKLISHKDFFQHVRAWGGSLASETGEILLAELGKLSIIGTSELTTQLDERGATLYSAKTQRNSFQGQIPAQVTIDIPVYRDREIAPQRITVLLEVHAKSDQGIFFKATAPALPLALLAARRDVRDYFAEKLGAEFSIWLGKGEVVP